MFVGPSYTVFGGTASRSRAVNLYLAPMEAPSKSQFVMASVPGLTRRASLGAPVRGAIEAGSRLFVVAGAKLYEISSAWVATERGKLATSTGNVGMAWGTTQVVIVDGANGYVLTLATNAFAQITDEDWPGSATVDYVNGFFTLIRPDTQQAYVTAIDDASNIDALDFVSAERVPDNTVGQACIFGEWWMLGTQSTEVWTAVPSSDFPFQRNNGANSDIGCRSAFSVKKIDNGLMMLGRDPNGAGMVYRSNGLQLVRVSTQAVEQALQDGDMTQASAYVYQDEGLTFYCLNVPGVASTWCYELSTGTWHERCDLGDTGQFIQHRVTHHAYAHGKNIGFDADGFVYELDRNAYTFDGDALVRERISPNSVTPQRDRVSYSEFVLDATTGEAPQGEEYSVELSWSNDGGRTYGNPVLRTLGRVGEYFSRVIWHRLGMARDRVWKLRYSGNTPFVIVSGTVR